MEKTDVAGDGAGFLLGPCGETISGSLSIVYKGTTMTDQKDNTTEVEQPESETKEERFPELALRSSGISPNDVTFYYLRHGIGVYVDDAGDQCRLYFMSFTPEWCGARAAGLANGDVVLAVDGIQMTDGDHVLQALAGDLWSPVQITTYRGTQIVDVTVYRNCLLDLQVVDVMYSAGDGCVIFEFSQPLRGGFYFVQLRDGVEHKLYGGQFLVTGHAAPKGP